MAFQICFWLRIRFMPSIGLLLLKEKSAQHLTILQSWCKNLETGRVQKPGWFSSANICSVMVIVGVWRAWLEASRRQNGLFFSIIVFRKWRLDIGEGWPQVYTSFPTKDCIRSGSSEHNLKQEFLWSDLFGGWVVHRREGRKTGWSWELAKGMFLTMHWASTWSHSTGTWIVP